MHDIIPLVKKRKIFFDIISPERIKVEKPLEIRSFSEIKKPLKIKKTLKAKKVKTVKPEKSFEKRTFLLKNSLKAGMLKTACLFLVVFLGWTSLNIIKTSAYFSDKETSLENVFAAGTLTLSWSWHSGPDNFVPKAKAENMKPGDKLTRVIQIINEGSLPFQYNARTEKVSGDSELCEALQLKAKIEGKTKINYEGSLMDFTFDPLELKTPPGIDTWQFKLSLPKECSGGLEGKTCKFNFVFEGWQLNSFDSSLGFSDTIEIANFVKTAITTTTEEIIIPSTSTIISTSLKRH